MTMSLSARSSFPAMARNIQSHMSQAGFSSKLRLCSQRLVLTGCMPWGKITPQLLTCHIVVYASDNEEQCPLFRAEDGSPYVTKPLGKHTAGSYMRSSCSFTRETLQQLL
ncbi:hypothetical protein AcW1_007071 [Taiwanofungus camphoratus]|nr:hypothetical protein AcV5_005426 [Antrodia cinnamomea]KAI0925202.1 hypothetical protein AcW2_005880 [Antrodia cinnamomea]KAI0955513.1 hypothetical protein AcW1_007071 [Antrodia cinnamomea]